MIPPMTDWMAVTPSALAAFPFIARGYPSKVVASADGVPGTFSRIAEREPPYTAPT